MSDTSGFDFHKFITNNVIDRHRRRIATCFSQRDQPATSNIALFRKTEINSV